MNSDPIYAIVSALGSLQVAPIQPNERLLEVTFPFAFHLHTARTNPPHYLMFANYPSRNRQVNNYRRQNFLVRTPSKPAFKAFLAYSTICSENLPLCITNIEYCFYWMCK